MSQPRCIAVIPARGGSVSIPKKNIKPLLGRPLIDWVVRPALDSGIFAEVYVSTDDDEIAEKALACGAKVHRRAAHTATNTASTESAIQDFVEAHTDYDVCCLIQATSPLLTPSDFSKGLRLFVDQKADSLVTAVRQHRFLWSLNADQTATAKNYDPIKRPRRQDWDGELIENGAFYFFSKANWTKNKCRLGGKTVLYEMEEHTFTELDSLVDWKVVSNMAADYGYFPSGSKPPPPDGSAEPAAPSATGYIFAAGAAAGMICALALLRIKQ